MTVTPRNVSDEQKITVTLSDVTSDSSAVLPDTAVSMNLLASDVEAHKTVDRSDAIAIKGQIGRPISGSNFRKDVKLDVLIDNNDVKAGKGDIGLSLP
jgi:hypothetical protein